MAVLAAIPMAFIPAFFFSWFLYWLDRYEKEPRWLLLMTFFWGGFFAIIGTLIVASIFEVGFSFVLQDAALQDIAGGSITAPLVEEFMKGLAVMLVFFLFRNEFDSILDGAIYGGIAGLGFAATENVFYFLGQYSDAGWAGMFTNFALRVGVFAWAHPFYTAFTGLGFAIARTNKNTLIKIIAPIIGYLLAVFAHSFHNTALVFVNGLGSIALIILLEWSGWLFFLGFVIWLISREQKLLKVHLTEEVQNGLISATQYKTAVSFFQFSARMAAISGGTYRTTDHFYQYLGELAHKKEQLRKFGEERRNTSIIEKLRANIASLAPQAQT